MDWTSPDIIDLLRRENLRISFAESCTGGRLAADLTTVPKSSSVVAGSIVCYELSAKRNILGLDVSEENVVSANTAMGMAEAAGRLFKTPLAVATTGWLHPSHAEGAHAFWALTWDASSLVKHTFVERVRLEGSRDQNRETLLKRIFGEMGALIDWRLGGVR